MKQLDPTFVRREIEHLRLTHPGIWEADDEQLLLDSLEGETDFHLFLTAVVRRIREWEKFAKGIGELIEETKERQQRYAQRVKSLRDMTLKLMTTAQVRKVELLEATVSVQAGVPKVIITDETLLPPDCIRTIREPSHTAIKDRIKRGEPVPGAEMSNAEPHIRIGK